MMLEALPHDLRYVVRNTFDLMEIAEDEIAVAKKAQPRATVLDRSFALLLPTQDIMNTDWLYRAHCRELLTRLVKGEDTRPGTDVEVIAAVASVTLKTPVVSAVAGLYERTFQRISPERYAQLFEEDWAAKYQHLYGPQIDEWEADTRRLTRQHWRQLSRQPGLEF
jgi:hypothetical protein